MLFTLLAFYMQQYNLMVCVDFSLIGYNPRGSLKLAGIANSLADDMKGL